MYCRKTKCEIKNEMWKNEMERNIYKSKTIILKMIIFVLLKLKPTRDRLFKKEKRPFNDRNED